MRREGDGHPHPSVLLSSSSSSSTSSSCHSRSRPPIRNAPIPSIPQSHLAQIPQLHYWPRVEAHAGAHHEAAPQTSLAPKRALQWRRAHPIRAIARCCSLGTQARPQRLLHSAAPSSLCLLSSRPRRTNPLRCAVAGHVKRVALLRVLRAASLPQHVLSRHPPTLQSSNTPMPPVSSAQAASVNGQCLVRPTVSHVNGRGRPSWSADPAAYHLPRLPQAGDGRLANACERHLRRAPIHPGRQASIAPSVSAAAHPTPCQSRP